MRIIIISCFLLIFFSIEAKADLWDNAKNFFNEIVNSKGVRDPDILKLEEMYEDGANYTKKTYKNRKERNGVFTIFVDYFINFQEKMKDCKFDNDDYIFIKNDCAKDIIEGAKKCLSDLKSGKLKKMPM